MKQSPRTNNEQMKGFSLIELMIAAVILLMILAIISTIIYGVHSSYEAQRPRAEAVSDATAALDSIGRLIRMAGNNPEGISGLEAIDPGTPVSGVFNTIRIRSDWRGTTGASLPDGDTNDPYEDITFLVTDGTLMKQEIPADTSPVEYLDHVGALRFYYFDSSNNPIADPVTNQALIARVDTELDTITPDGATITFATTVYLRNK